MGDGSLQKPYSDKRLKMINITGKEFVKKLLQGEKDFNRITLVGNKDLTEYVPQLKEFLITAQLEKESISLEKSVLGGIILPNIYLPYFNFSGANMSGACISGANMSGANLQGANMSPVYMSEVDLSGANLCEVDLSGANMSGANMIRTNLWRANMSEADLRGVKNLDYAHNLIGAIFQHTIVTNKEKDIIEKARQKLKLYDLRRE